METTAAVVREKEQPFSLENLEIEEPREDEVLVRIVGAGLCHTDLIVRDQWYPVPLPAVLGHEGSGVVERVGSGVTKVQPGDHVVLSFNHCGQCANCLTGKPSYCHAFFELNFGGSRPDGSCSLSAGGEAVHSHFFGQSSFSTYSLAAQNSVVRVPQNVPLESLGPLGCGVQTGAGAVLNSLQPEPGSSIAIFGTGAVGISAILAAVVAGCTTIIGVDVKPSRLELARELGATHTVNAAEEDPVEEITAITGGGANYTLETTGVPAVLRAAVESLSTLGTCGIVGAPPLGTEVSLDMNNVMIPGRVVRGIIEGDSVPEVFIPRLIDLHEKGRFPFDRLVRYFDLDQINEAAADAESGGTLKPVLRIA